MLTVNVMHETVEPMYGKHFASMYGGSMFGKPAVVFAVWGYVIALMRPSRKDGQCYVELNPALLAATFATTTDEILEAIATLEAPDPGSRSKVEEGRRLACLTDEKSIGPMQFRVVNGQHYRNIRDEEERREYLRIAKQRSRSKPSTLSTESTTVNRSHPESTQVEGEEEVEGKAGEAKASPRSRSAPSDVSSKLFKASARDLVEGLTLDAALFSKCKEIAPNHNPTTELEAFKDRMRANGYKAGRELVKDARAAFRNHMRNAVIFASAKPAEKPKPAPFVPERKLL